MKVLIACEESQRVCTAFRERGHEAYSCDIIECSGGHPEWHIMQDVLPLLNGFCGFDTMDGVHHYIGRRWDLIIAHPPCTYLSNAGACRLYPKKGQLDMERYQKGLEAKEFFLRMLNADCERVCVENPVSSTVFQMPPHTQEIQPWQFGHSVTKKTRLWLRGLPPVRHICSGTDCTVYSRRDGEKRPHEVWTSFPDRKRFGTAKQNLPRNRKSDGGAVGIGGGLRNNMTEKYRAKRKYGGDWVVGRYVPPGHYFGDGGTHAIEYANREDDDALPISMDIIYPDTLSRCSGLTACGEDVYEGDIVRLHIDHTSEFWMAVVRFGWHDTHEYGWYLEPIRDTVFTKRIGAWLGENAAFGITTVAVIGNVWDNPEMMGEKHG